MLRDMFLPDYHSTLKPAELTSKNRANTGFTAIRIYIYNSAMLDNGYSSLITNKILRQLQINGIKYVKLVPANKILIDLVCAVQQRYFALIVILFKNVLSAIYNNIRAKLLHA